MDSPKSPLVFFVVLFFYSINFYGQDICTNYTVTPGTTISFFGGTYNSVINVPDSYTISDVNVTVNISHTRNEDLDISLISPSGTTIELSTDKGGRGDDYNNVTFDDASTNTLPTTNTNLSGTYQPEESLAGLNGENSNGNWNLRVIDDAFFSGGTINSITLNLCYTPVPVGGYLGPGGVGTNDGTSNLVLWLDASVGTTSSVTNWPDQSGNINGNNATPTSSAARPSLVSSGINGYDYVNFDGNDQLTVTDNASLDLTAWDIFTVTRANNHKKYNAVITKGLDAYENYELLSYDDAHFHTPIIHTNGVRSLLNSTIGVYSDTDFDIFEYSFSSAVGRDIYKNHGIIGTDNETRIPATNNHDLYIGNEKGKTRFLEGRISEVLIYNTPVNLAQRIIINNYLAAKYDRTLVSEDYYSQDNPGQGNFDHDVAGIGQASDGSNHTDSQGTGIVRINNPRTLGNDRFLFWGEETKDPTYIFSTNTGNYTEQLNSKWRVSRKNNSGGINRVDISFDISGMDLTGKQSCRPLQLVVDNNYNCSSPNENEVYDLTIVGSTATATNIRLINKRYFTLRYVDQIVWDDGTYYNASSPSDAPNDSDACLKLTIKSGSTATLTDDAHVREIEVEAGATLNVANGILLKVENQVVINGTLNLLGEAQLIQNHSSTTSNSGSGHLTKGQQGVSNFFNYNYWSSPVNTGGSWQIGNLEDASGVITFAPGFNGDASTTPITLSSRWLYSFNGAEDNYYYWNRITTSTPLLPGIGYTMKGSGSTAPEQEYIFRGLPNDGNYNFLVVAGNDFLVGNPYPSALDADLFINDNLSVIDGTLRFWEQFTTNNSHYLKDYEGGYARYNLAMGLRAAAVPDDSGLTSGNGTASKGIPTQFISVGQGFFVNIENSGSLVFNNQQRVFKRESLGETTFYKSSSKKEKTPTENSRTKIWFSFTKSGSFKKFIGLASHKNASNAFDKGYDAILYNEDILRNDMYWLLDDKKMAIQALSEINSDDSLPLETKITDAGNYEFGIEDMQNAPDDLNIYLKDNYQNVFYDLRENNAQIFLETGEDPVRFSIVFKNENILTTDDITKNTKYHVSYNPKSNDLTFYGLDDLSTLRSLTIHNLLGQEIMSLQSLKSNTINISNLSSGMYTLKINLENNNTIKPIKFIKN